MTRRPAAPEERIHPTIVAAAVRALAALDPAAAPDLSPGEPVARSRKIALLDRVRDLGGTDAVLSAGQRLRDAQDDPLLAVLLNSDSVAVLLDKVAGLNRYFHSNHRHAVVESADGRLVLDHMAIAGDPPLAIESLFTCGLYIALLEEIGCQDLVCSFADLAGRLRVVWQQGGPLHGARYRHPALGVPVDRICRPPSPARH